MSYSFFNPPDDPLQLDASGRPIYGLGLLPSPIDKGGLPRARQHFPIIPRAQWKAISFKQSRPFKILYQKHNDCVGHGTATAANKCWRGAGGAEHTFSADWIYGHINGGRDAGASIVAAFNSLQRDGICFEEQVPEGMIWKQQFPAEAFETAKRFTGWQGYVCDSVEEMVSAMLQGAQPVFGVTVGGAFQAYRGQGLIRVGWGPANHCVCADGLAFMDGQPVLDMVNSWSEGWGAKGRGWLALDSVARDELFVLTAPPIDPEETMLPPKAETLA